jgi:glycosyltransferase involved in cell wall biosynthesis
MGLIDMKNKTITNQPIVSVVVPLYNAASFMSRAIESILRQTYTNLEIILVNDGSSDNTLKMCSSYAQSDKRFVIYSQVNAGAAAARNVGVSLATGKYLTFIDSDDWVDDEYLAKLVKAAQDSNSQISVCDYFYVEDEVSRRRKVHSKSKVLSGTEAVRDFLLDGSILETMLWNKLYERELFIGNDITIPKAKIYEDTRVMYQILFYANKVAYIDVPLYYYAQRAGSVMHHTVNLSNASVMLTTIPDEASMWLNKRTNKLTNELNAYNARGIINSLNYMVDGGTVLSSVWTDARKRILTNLRHFMMNPTIAASRKCVLIVALLGAGPYGLIRKRYTADLNKDSRH